MKNLTHAASLAAAIVLAGSATVLAQQPAPRAGPPQGTPAPQGQPEARRPGLGGPGMPGFAVAMFNPSHLLERREILGLTADQVTRISALENELKAAREKAETDAKPHREELEKALKSSSPDAAQVRTHAQAMMTAQQGAQLATLTTAVQAKAILTAEQRGRVQGWADGGPRMGLRRMGPAPRMAPGGPGGQPEGMRFRRRALRQI